MSKKVRVLLYLTSATVAVLVLILMICVGGKKFSASTWGDHLQETTEVTENTELATEETYENNPQDTDEKIDKEEPEGDTVLVFGGDVLIKESSEEIYEKDGIAGLIDETLLAEMRNADICMVNHEFQLSSQGEPMADKQFTFQTAPQNVEMLVDLGVDIVSLANNHSLDYGKEGLIDTMLTLDEMGILHAGAGETKERAEELQIIESNGKTFGFLAATHVIPSGSWDVEVSQPGLFAFYNNTRLLEVIEEASNECDFLTVYVHWGIERVDKPLAYQRTMAKQFAEAGADLIIGAHPHVLQGIEFFDETPAFYSLGNYIFSYNTARTMLLKVVVKADDTVEYSMIPAYAANSKTQVFEGEKIGNLYDYMNRISTKDFVNADGSITDKPEQTGRNITYYEVQTEE